MTDFHLAEFNFGTLKYDWDDPRIADFQNNLDLVNGIAAKSPGFIWRMSDEEMEKGQAEVGGVFEGNPRTASTLSVWKDAESLSHFVWKTVHRRFFDRRREWYDEQGNGNFVMWWVDKDTRPTLQEGMDRFHHWQEHADTEFSFGWKHLYNEK